VWNEKLTPAISVFFKFQEPDNRKQKFADDDVSPRKGDAHFHDSFGRPGAGAPLRTNSGNLRAEISGDPNIRFHQAENNPVIRQHIGENMRYVTRPDRGREYANELGMLITVICEYDWRLNLCSQAKRKK
jgi:hypothetical protein